MLELLAAAASMAMRDACSTWKIIAEAHFRPVLAGSMDALEDLAGVLVTVVSAGAVLEHGLTVATAEILAVMTATSFFGTILWTKLGKRWMPDDRMAGVS